MCVELQASGFALDRDLVARHAYFGMLAGALGSIDPDTQRNA
jgi:hypothetical protein